MDEQTDKRKIMTPARQEHMRKMRAALAQKKEMAKNQPKAAPKAKRTPPKPVPVEDTEDVEEIEDEELSEEEVEEVVPAKRKVTKKAPAPKKAPRPDKDMEIYELGKRVYKENKKKQLLEEVKQFILQEFAVGGDEESYEDEQEPQQPQQRNMPSNNLLSIF